MNFDPRQTAGDLFDSMKHRRVFTASTDIAAVLTLDEAYRVQEHLIALMCDDEQATIAGYKVAMVRTGETVLPVAGAILSGRVRRSGDELRFSDHVRLGVEPELCFRMGVDITPEMTEAAGRIRDFVDGVAPAYEIIDDRGATIGDFEPSALIAENGWCKGVVLGDFVPLPAPPKCRATYRSGAAGEDVAEGVVDVDERLAALSSLVRTLQARGLTLARGHVAMSGSVFPLQFPANAGSFAFEVAGIGRAEVSCAGAPASALSQGFGSEALGKGR